MQFAPILPDEFARGYLSRLCHLNRYRDRKEALFELRENYAPQIERKLFLHELLAAHNGQNATSFLQRHSVVGLLLKTGFTNSRRSGAHLWPASFEIGARFCSTCVRNDMKSQGFAYWRTDHQLPGEHLCMTHRVTLNEYSGRGLLPQSALHQAVNPTKYLAGDLQNKVPMQIFIEVLRRYRKQTSHVSWQRLQKDPRIQRVLARECIKSTFSQTYSNEWLLSIIRYGVEDLGGPNHSKQFASPIKIALLAGTACDSPEEGLKMVFNARNVNTTKRYCSETKLSTVRAYEGNSVAAMTEFAKSHGLNVHTFASWLTAYRTRGPSAFDVGGLRPRSSRSMA